jgi:predicted nucleotidyltransferase
MSAKIPIPREKIAEFCDRWKITELALFGSVLRDDFRPDSDVDVLVTFAPEAEWSLFDHMTMEEELSSILDRKVDLVSRRAIERSRNWIRRKAILEAAEPFYVAR